MKFNCKGVIGRIILLSVLLAVSGCQSKERRKSSPSQHAIPNEGVYSEGEHQAYDGLGDLFPESEYSSGLLYINGDSLAIEDILKPLQPKLLEATKGRSEEEYMRYVAEQVRDELIRQVQDLLLYQEASKSMTAQITEAIARYVDQEIKDRVNREFSGRQARLEVYLAARQTTMEEYRQKERRRIIVIKYLQDNVVPQIADPSRQELLDFYHQNLDQYARPESRELFMIDIPKAEQEQEAKVLIEEAINQLRAGAPFETLAQTYSKGIHAGDGGCWSYIRTPLQGRYAAVSAVFFELDENEISDVIETEEAFFIVKAGTIQPARRESFADVQPELVERYRNFHFETLRRRQVQSLLEKAVIEPDEEKFLRMVLESARKHYHQSRQP